MMSAMNPHPLDNPELPRLGQGFYWQDLRVGQQFRTWQRTVTETDLVQFISVTGMLEAIFIDADQEGAMSGRPVPAALTYTLIEGLLLQSMIQGTGLAMLELVQKILAPVRVGDRIGAVVEIRGIRPTSRLGRAIVDSRIDVYNQSGDKVMQYDARRMLAGRPGLSTAVE